MQFWIMKSGLEIFDVARAYGLAALLKYANEDVSEPLVEDKGMVYLVTLPEGRLSSDHLRSNTGWLDAFHPGEFGDPLSPAWNGLFVTDTAKFKESKRREVRQTLEEQLDNVLRQAQEGGLVANFEGDETLPGGLDPAAFKGLRGRTRGQYVEGQSKVDKANWALACLGGALTGRFIYQRNAYFVVYPVPERIEWSQFREVRQQTYGERLNYISAQNAAAHYSVVLADHLRSRAASASETAPRYSSLLYFSLFKTGNQWKPGNAGKVNLRRLTDLALGHPHESEGVFKVWNYLFLRGSVKGNADMAVAITQLVMDPKLESYEQHVKVFLRYLALGVKVESQYTNEPLQEVTTLVDPKLTDVYGNPSIKRFGQAYRRALRDPAVQDYASLIDLENAETPEALAEALRRFLRRNHRPAIDNNWIWPGDHDLEAVMALAQASVPLVRAAIESYALLWEPDRRKQPQSGKEEAA